MYGERSLPPALEHFCEGKLPSFAQSEGRGILSALFVPSLQAMKLREVEDLARQPESKWRELFLRLSPTSVVASVKAASLTIPREVAATVLELADEGGEELEDTDVEAFKKDIESLQVGGLRVRDREPASRRPPCGDAVHSGPGSAQPG